MKRWFIICFGVLLISDLVAQVSLNNMKDRPVWRITTALSFDGEAKVGGYYDFVSDLSRRGVQIESSGSEVSTTYYEDGPELNYWWNYRGRVYSESAKLAQAILKAVLKADRIANNYQSNTIVTIYDYVSGNETFGLEESSKVSSMIGQKEFTHYDIPGYLTVPGNLFQDLLWFHLGTTKMAPVYKATNTVKIGGNDFSNDTLMNFLILDKVNWKESYEKVIRRDSVDEDGYAAINSFGVTPFTEETTFISEDILMKIGSEGFVYREDWSLKNNKFYMNVLNVSQLLHFKIITQSTYTSTSWHPADLTYFIPIDWTEKKLETVLTNVSYRQPLSLSEQHISFFKELVETVGSDAWEIYDLAESKERNIDKVDVLCRNSKIPVLKDTTVYGTPGWLWESRTYYRDFYNDSGENIGAVPYQQNVPWKINDICGMELLVDWKQDKVTAAIVKEVNGFMLLRPMVSESNMVDAVSYPIYFMKK